MKNIFILLLLCCSFFLIEAQSNITKSFVFGGLTRDYIIHLPTGYSTSTKYPVVFNLHGYTSNATEEQLYTKMDNVANTDAQRFIVVYPNGVLNAWNSWSAGGIDDVGFISEIIDSMNAQYNIDLNRVYSCGMSNGGFQSYRMACELSNRIVAIASVTGSMSDYVYANCNPSRAVPVLEIHGTADITVPYDGLTGSKNTETVFQFWKDHNACGTSDTTAVANISLTDNCTVDKIKYNTCDEASKVWLFKVWDGGHSWPDALIDIVGINTNHDINASQEIWDFFKQFSFGGSSGMAAETQNIAKLQLFPNPANDQFTISADIPLQKIIVSDVFGNVVQIISLQNEFESRLSISNLANGVYTVQVINAENMSSTQKLFVLH